MHIDDYLDSDKLSYYVNEGLVSARTHPALPLVIYNYTPEAAFSNTWDDVTIRTRGLIVDTQTREIVARPFQKFFNLGDTSRPETWEDNLPNTVPEVTEKLDGSLGILYCFGNDIGVATRGSFTSEQACWATDWLTKNRPDFGWPGGWTPLVEIIYPNNQIVVDYRDFEGLVPLSMVHNKTGVETPHWMLKHWSSVCWKARIVEQFHKSLSECTSENNNNAEGYVLTWHNTETVPFRVKVKFADYVRLHRLITGISPKEIWRLLSNQTSADWWNYTSAHIPEHFRQWVRDWEFRLLDQYVALENAAKHVFTEFKKLYPGNTYTRKQAAAFFTKYPAVQGILFNMLDGRDYSQLIWKLCKPRGNVFRADGV